MTCSLLRNSTHSNRLLHSARGRLRTVVYSSPEPPKETKEDSNTVAPSSAPSDGKTNVQKILGEDASLQIPKEVIDRLKFTVFGFDTFWVTSVENYETDGVIFKGNVRGKDVQSTFEKMNERLSKELGDKYRLFLLEDQEQKPTAIVLPKDAGREASISKFTEIWLATLFAVATIVTSFNANGVPLLEFLADPSTEITQQDFNDALPAVLAFWAAIGAHEAGHWFAANRQGMQLYLPFFVPAGFGFLGGFGSITRIRGFVKSRESLLDFAVHGPLVGAAASGALVLVGFALSVLGQGDTVVESGAFADSFLMAVAAQAFLGERLVQPEVVVHPLLIAGWAALIANSLACIPAGELDGGRMALSLWGRRTANVVSGLSLLALGFSAITNPLSFYWGLLVVFLQRGPPLPCYQELSEPQDKKNITYAYVLMALSLAVLLPFPIELMVAMNDMQSPALF